MSVSAAIRFAVRAHEGQTDKQGRPYIFHVLRVMLACDGGHDLMQVAVLHDVLEDTLETVGTLRKFGYGDTVIDAVVALTRRKGEETYAEYIERVALNPLAVRVKLADLEDNLSRIGSLPAEDRLSLGARYRKALKRLESVPV